MITTCNFHFLGKCNSKCKYCFSNSFNPRPLPIDDLVLIIDLIAKYSSEKNEKFKHISFSGGEPLMEAGALHTMLKRSKEDGLLTSLITNGSLLTEKWIKNNAAHIDQIGISLDTLENSTSNRIGRIPIAKEKFKALVKCIKEHRIELKINTVVSNYNSEELLKPFIQELSPSRWKIIQAMKVEEENDLHFDKLEVSPEAFDNFFKKNTEGLDPSIKCIKESNSLMRSTYVMINPMGCFFDSSKGRHNQSKPILEVGVAKALQEVYLNEEGFKEREGDYSFSNETLNFPSLL